MGPEGTTRTTQIDRHTITPLFDTLSQLPIAESTYWHVATTFFPDDYLDQEPQRHFVAESDRAIIRDQFSAFIEEYSNELDDPTLRALESFLEENDCLFPSIEINTPPTDYEKATLF